MKFTDKYIQLPIKIFDTQQKELTGDAEYFDTHMYVLPSEISNFKISDDEENGYDEVVSIKLKNGESFYVYMTLKEFIQTLNKHQEGLYAI